MAFTAQSNLQKGMKGDEVKELQTLLNQNGYDLDVDGSFGGKTLAAVKDYQAKNGMYADGIVGAKTYGALTSGNTAGNATAATASAPRTAQSLWAQYDQTMSEIQNRKPFSYDVNSDKLAQVYKTQYENAGLKAMRDTIARASALTGGYGNSYAQTAGQEAYNAYAAEYANRIPELEALAYSRYQDEQNAKMQDASMLFSRAQAQEATDQQKFANDMAIKEYDLAKKSSVRSSSGSKSTGGTQDTRIKITAAEDKYWVEEVRKATTFEQAKAIAERARYYGDDYAGALLDIWSSEHSQNSSGSQIKHRYTGAQE